MRRRSTRGLVFTFALLVGSNLWSSEARAQASASDKAAAEALFDQGVALMKRGSFQEACPKLEESQRIDPAVGTLLYLAECYERSGRTASAWATFREAASVASTSGQTDRARVASQRADAVEPKLSRLTIEVAPELSKVPGLSVLRGGKPVEPSLLGTPLPIDPGEYRVDVSAPGYAPWNGSVTVPGNAANATLKVPMLEPRPEAAGPPPAAPSAPAAEASALSTERTLAAPAPSDAGGLTGQQTVGLIVGGVGVVGLGVGGFFGVRAISKNSDAEKECPDNLCNQRGFDLTNDAKDAAKISNIAFAAGGVLVATGVVLYLTGGSSRETASLRVVPSVVPGLGGARLEGSF